MNLYKSTKHTTTYKSKFSPKDFDKALLAKSKAQFYSELEIGDRKALVGLYNLKKKLCKDFLTGCDCSYELLEK